MKLLRTLTAILVRVETVLLVVFLSLMGILAFAQVILRNVFGTGILWADPMVRQMVLWSGFMGAALATSADRHISVDAFTKYLSARTNHTIKIITSLAAAIVTFFLAQGAWEFVLAEKDSGGEIFLGISSWVGLTIIPAGYILIMIHFLIQAIEVAVKRFSRTPAEAGRA
jgi:TRAP-type C4-dicarboxylate transport system permease small subunit